MARFKLLFLLLLIFQLTSEAQIQKGSIPLAGGFLVGQTNGISDYRSNVNAIFPSSGYFFNNNFGIIGGFSSTNLKTAIKNFPLENQIYNSKINGLNVFVGARYYLPFLDYRAFLQLDIINQNSGRGEVNGTKLDGTNTFRSKIAFGANGWLSENISIEGIIKFGYFKNESNQDRFRLGKGPFEMLFNIKPYINNGWSSAPDLLDNSNLHVGGSASFRHSLKANERIINGQIVDNPSLRISFQPKFGYFLFDNALVGLAGGISYEDDEINSPISLGVSPYLRYYIRVTEGLQVVPNFTYVYNYLNFRNKAVGSSQKTATFQFIPAIGLHTFLSEGIGLFGNGILNLKRQPTTSNLDLRKQTILQFQLGLEYYLSAN